jgi:NAD(P)-dependent dehydrogenase (short-subunit alcohol dehydrogenase family)
MAGRLQGKAALITGGASGIGRAAAIVFAREGAKLAIADIKPQGAEVTVDSIRQTGGEAIFVRCDVSSDEQVRGAIDTVVKTYGRLDCAFNNAGIIAPIGKLADETEEWFERTIAVNLKGVWSCMRHEIRQMLKQGGGAIVNTASAAGLVGSGGSAAYTAAKHGVVGLTKAAAVEYARSGIRVNAVCPGVIDTPLVEQMVADRPKLATILLAAEPIGRKGRPEEIGEAVAWLCSDAASFVTGWPMAVDGGLVSQ